MNAEVKETETILQGIISMHFIQKFISWAPIQVSATYRWLNSTYTTQLWFLMRRSCWATQSGLQQSKGGSESCRAQVDCGWLRAGTKTL